MHLLTAHGWLSFQPDGRVEYRPADRPPGAWESFELVGLVELLRASLPVPPTPAVPPTLPVPTDDALLGCRGATSPIELVRCLCEKIRPAGSQARALEVAWRVANALGAGLLLKESGENILDYHGKLVSISRICYPDGHIVKVLSDAGGEGSTNGPTWQDDGEVVDRRRFVPLVSS